jgi:hypothetical protein
MDISGEFESLVADLKKSTCPITEIEYTTPGLDFLGFFITVAEEFPDIQSIKYYTIMPIPRSIRNVSNTQKIRDATCIDSFA